MNARICSSVFVGLLLMIFAFIADALGLSVDITSSNSVGKLNQVLLGFTENQGQWDETVKFRANAGGATLWFTEEGVYYQFTRRIERDNPIDDEPIPIHRNELDQKPDSVEQLVIKASFTRANPDLKVVGEGLMDYRCNYFIGDDPSKWHTDVPNYESVTLRNLYDGVDLHFYGGDDGTLIYSYSIAPDADTGAITVDYECPEEIHVDESGKVATDTRFGEITGLLGPPGRNGDTYSAELSVVPTYGGEFDSDGRSSTSRNPDGVPLAYSTYLGGSDYDYGYGIAVDGSGNAYVTGFTSSADFPTQNPYQMDQPGADVFVTKLSSSGDSLIYSTYLGGNDGDIGSSIAVDGSGCAYVAGYTYSSDFPTQDPYQTYQGNGDVFVTKLSSSGSSLIYSTYLGGNSNDEGYAIAVDDSGNAYVTGNTFSSDFPTQDPFQTNQPLFDAFVTKLSSSGSSLIYSTYLGGNDDDYGYGIAVDDSGDAYVTGWTLSTDFPTQNPYQTNQPSTDVFVTKLSSSGSSLIYGTYLGGNSFDQGYGIAVDGSGDAYVTGDTWSIDFPTQNPYQTDQPSQDGFVAKLSAAGSSLIYSTYLGGNDYDEGWGIAINDDGNAYVIGRTVSTDYPTQNPYQTDQPDWDVFVTKLSSPGSSLISSTYLGGRNRDYGGGIAVDSIGDAYLTGHTYSTDFPTQNPYQASHHGGSIDAFVCKLMLVEYTCGDADGSGGVDIDDVVYLIAYIFSGGPAPDPLEAGDADCSGAIDIDDVVYLIAYIFSGGPPPGDPNDDGVPDC